MNKLEQFIENNGKLIYFLEWKSSCDLVKGCVLILHGMAEHINRYDRFAEFANKEGYQVYGFDQRGHGFTATSKETLGLVDEKKGWQEYLDDVLFVVNKLRQDHPNTKIYLLGHSMGSFIARDFMLSHSDLIEGLILSGSADLMLTDLLMGLTLSKTEKFLKGSDQDGELVNHKLNKINMKRFKPKQTPYDWLNSNQEEVQQYIDDPYSGFCPKIGFFIMFFRALIALHDTHAYNRVSKETPILLLSGQKDPVTNMGLGTVRLYEKYQKLGVMDLKMKLYPGMRHEILNETDREYVFKDIIQWIDLKMEEEVLIDKKNHRIS